MADACRRAAVDQIAWLQRGERRKMRDQARDRKDHQLGISILAQLAVEIGAHRQILRILDVCNDPWPQWFISWLALGAQPLLVCILIGAVRHIVAAGVAQHIIQRFFFADTAAATADHRHQLAFIIHRVIQTADHDRRIWPGDRRREPWQRLAADARKRSARPRPARRATANPGGLRRLQGGFVLWRSRRGHRFLIRRQPGAQGRVP